MNKEIRLKYINDKNVTEIKHVIFGAWRLHSLLRFIFCFAAFAFRFAWVYVGQEVKREREGPGWWPFTLLYEKECLGWSSFVLYRRKSYSEILSCQCTHWSLRSRTHPVLVTHVQEDSYEVLFPQEVEGGVWPGDDGSREAGAGGSGLHIQQSIRRSSGKLLWDSGRRGFWDTADQHSTCRSLSLWCQSCHAFHRAAPSCLSRESNTEET